MTLCWLVFSTYIPNNFLQTMHIPRNGRSKSFPYLAQGNRKGENTITAKQMNTLSQLTLSVIVLVFRVRALSSSTTFQLTKCSAIYLFCCMQSPFLPHWESFVFASARILRSGLNLNDNLAVTFSTGRIENFSIGHSELRDSILIIGESVE